jgi:serine/threonine protein kinase
MTIASGTRLGPYEIVSPLGAGGMGEVYRAKDTRLDRTVAVKILPSHLSADPAFRQRFEREARVISSLSHANICALHDVGHQDGISFLVMEFLEGETLADRLTKGPLTTEHALHYGIQIADALDKAHRRGIVHRDLKPGNIMLTKSGVKLLDFGLAKSRPIVAGNTEMSTSPTVSRPLTAEGTIVGTLQYMAPEQLEGKEIDSRTDIFAFGAVLYEMITGKRAFAGNSKASLIAAILDKDPRPISEIQPMTPPALDRTVKTCLAKDPDDRWQSAHDVMSQLKWIVEVGSQAGIPSPIVAKRKSRERLTWILTVCFFLAALGLAFTAFHLYEAKPKVLPARAFILPPEGSKLSFSGLNAGSLTLSPDGHWVTFAVSDSSGKSALWLRALDSLEARLVPGTEGATFPFWSPDSRFIGFFESGKMKKTDISGGPALTICDAQDGRGGTWNQDGVILFSPTSRDPIDRVSATGGTPVPITKINEANQETSHRYPFFLSDGKHFLYFAASAMGPEGPANAIYVASLDGKENKLLVKAGSNAIYADGLLLFMREKVLMGQHFDPGHLAMKGDPFPIAEQIKFVGLYWRGTFSASNQGFLVYVKETGNDPTQLTWLDRQGKKIESVGEHASYRDVSLSPDGKKAVVSIADSDLGSGDLWLYDLSKNVRTRFTFNPANDFSPVWTPDGRQIVFATDKNGNDDIYQKLSNGSGQEEPLVQTKANESPDDWSADGRFLCYNYYDPKGKTKTDIWILPFFGDRKPFAFLQTEFGEYGGVFSPDGRWLAYVSYESGKPEVYVSPFPGGVGKWQVSKGGGLEAYWRNDGKEIIYVSSDNKIMSVQVKTEPNFESRTPVSLFDGNLAAAIDISADGQRFMVTMREKPVADQLILVTNWTASLPH